MKVAYVYHQHNKHTFAGDTIAMGFQNAFQDMGVSFRFFNTQKIAKRSWEKFSLCMYNPDIIFTSVENIGLLPLDYLKQKKLVLWGQFYTPCDYELQIHSIANETKYLLNKYRDKHDILIWSQHEDEINERFFQGYTKELGLKFTKLLHAADKTLYQSPLLHPTYDFVWIGNIGHRKERYERLVSPLKDSYTRFFDFSEHGSISPKEVLAHQLYRNSFIAPNIHTDAQVKHEILLNERVFSAPIQGGFQICDNLIAKKYFSEDELIVTDKLDDYLEIFHHYKSHPEKRVDMINRLKNKIEREHTYHNRIATIYSSYQINE